MAGAKWRPGAGSFEFDTEASLRLVIEAIRALDPPPAFAVVGGDLASPDVLYTDRVLTPEEYEPSYHLFKRLMERLPCPVHFLIGNHDDRIAYNRVLRTDAPNEHAQHYYSFNYLNHHFVALDSHEPRQAAGLLDSNQLVWLKLDLTLHRDLPTVVFVHHPPWPLGIRWLDAVRLQNGAELMAILSEHARIGWVICGHVHLDQVVQRGRLTMLTTPSTCTQLSKVSQTPKALAGPPAFRVVDVSDTNLSSRVLCLRGASPTEV